MGVGLATINFTCCKNHVVGVASVCLLVAEWLLDRLGGMHASGRLREEARHFLQVRGDSEARQDG